MNWKFILSAVVVAILLVSIVTVDFEGMFISTKAVKGVNGVESSRVATESTSTPSSGRIHIQKAPPSNGPEPISDCGAKVNESGNYYLVNNVSSNLSSTCVDIIHDDVVFNCQGHKVSNSGVAVNTHGHSNITIVNCEFFSNDISIYNPNSTGYTFVKNSSLVNSIHWGVYSLSSIMLNDTLFGKMSSATTKFNITGTGLAIHITNTPNLPDGYVGSENFFIMTNLSSNSWAQIFEYYDENKIPANESTLEMWKYNSSWHKLPGTDLDTDDNMVYSGNVTSFSTFGILGLPIPVTNCTNLTNANKMYIITENISGLQSGRNVCIDIQADNITLDGQGYLINGVGNGTGIYLDGHNNTIITNALISNYSYGIRFNSSSHNTLTNNTANSNKHYGIYFVSSSNNTLTNNTANLNNYGIFLNSSSINTLTNNTANSNKHYGIYFVSSSNNILTNNTINSNRYYGIRLSSSSHNSIANNIVLDNSDGIILGMSSNYNNLINNTANNNTYSGIGMDTSTNNLFANNTASGNLYGIHLGALSNNNVLLNNNASFNGNHGMYITSSLNNTFDNNILNSNGLNGISFTISSSNNILTNNTFNSNGNCGISLTSFSNSTLTNNTIASNSIVGIYFSSSSNNILTNNVITNNTLWDFYSIDSINNTVLNLTVNTTTSSFTYKDISIKSAISPDEIPADYKDLEKYMQITNLSSNSWIHLNISYTDSDVTSKNIDESTIRLWRFNGTWQPPETAATVNTVNTKLNYVHSEISSFSIFTLIGKEITPATTTSSPARFSSSTIQPPLVCSNGIAYYYFHKVSANETVMPDKIFCNDLRIVSITTAENLYQSKIQISKSTTSEEIPNIQYKYFNLSKVNLNSSQLSDLSFELRVNKSWIAENGVAPSTIKLYKYNNGWSKLDTKLVYDDNDYYYYHASTKDVPEMLAASGAQGVDFWTVFNYIQDYYNGKTSFNDVVKSVDVYYSS